MEDRRTNDTTPTPGQQQPMRRSADAAATPRSDQPVTRTEQATARTNELRLVDQGSMAEFERRWHAVQAEFVEDPRRAVGDAGNLMAELMDHISRNLRQRRGDLERGGDMDTEAMRQELRRYRSILQRVLGQDEQAQPGRMPAKSTD